MSSSNKLHWRKASALEHDIQVQLFKWAGLMSCQYPELKGMFAIPNGGLRTAVTGARLKAEGAKSGVPDIFLPAPRVGSAGLFVEMKRKEGVESANQKDWRLFLTAQGYTSVVCFSFDEAVSAILEHLGKKKMRITQ